jgi:hypothetical protein
MKGSSSGRSWPSIAATRAAAWSRAPKRRQEIRDAQLDIHERRIRWNNGEA